MRKFSFRLEKIQRFKEHEIDLLYLQLFQLRQKIEETGRLIKKWEKQEEENRQALAELFFPVYFLQIVHRNFLLSQKRKEENLLVLAQLRQEEESCLRSLAYKLQEKRILERVRERKWSQYLTQCAKEEQKFLDDVKNYSYA